MQTSVRKMGKTNVEILYVVFIRMSGELILEDRKIRKYGPDRNQCHLFFLFSRKNIIKVISAKVTLIVTDSQFIDAVVSAAGIKRRLVA